ncbi:alanine racemase, partial [Marinobacter sp.]
AEPDLANCAEQGFEPVLHSWQQLTWLADSRNRPRLWLKVNSGMNRLGFHPEELANVMQRLDRAGALATFEGFVTHFACADDVDSSMTVR